MSMLIAEVVAKAIVALGNDRPITAAMHSAWLIVLNLKGACYACNAR
jgi:hypothetical protein